MVQIKVLIHLVEESSVTEPAYTTPAIRSNTFWPEVNKTWFNAFVNTCVFTPLFDVTVAANMASGLQP